MTVAVLWVAGCGDGKVDQVTSKPVAAFKVTQSSARPQVFNFDASTSYTTVGQLKSWSWTFGDEGNGAPTVLGAGTTLHAYAAPGSYTVTLVVADDKGALSEPVSHEVSVPSVNAELPKARISAPASGTPGNALSFDGSASTPENDLLNFAWEFGDPAASQNSAAGKIAQHAFTAAGTYRVTLTVTDSLGQSDTAEVQLPISSPGPLAVCTFTPQPPLLGVAVQFDGSQSTPLSGSTIAAYSWDFGDGSPAGAGVAASHTYNVKATFKPKLTVTDSLARIGLASCPDLIVQDPPLCSGDYTLSANPPTASCLGSTVTWGGNRLTVVQHLDGGMVATEALPSSLKALDGGTTATYAGSYSGASFTLQGGYLASSGLGASRTDVTISGQLAGCASFTGTWNEKVSTSGLQLCDYTFNVSGAKL